MGYADTQNGYFVTMTPNEIKRIIEALILSSDAPMSLAHIKSALDTEINNDTLQLLVEDIKSDWSGRAVQLVQVATGYRFQTTADVLPYIDRLRAEKPVQYSRAVLETLAIIAYRQPVTRGDIEDIRGVTVSSQIIKTLEERGWIDVVGHREVPGRPALLATTKNFLDDLGLLSLKELPTLVGQVDDENGQLVLVNHSEADEIKPESVNDSALAEKADSAVEALSQNPELAQMVESIQGSMENVHFEIEHSVQIEENLLIQVDTPDLNSDEIEENSENAQSIESEATNEHPTKP